VIFHSKFSISFENLHQSNMFRPSVFFDFTNNTAWPLQITRFLKRNILNCVMSTASSLLGPHIFLRTLFLDTCRQIYFLLASQALCSTPKRICKCWASFRIAGGVGLFKFAATPASLARSSHPIGVRGSARGDNAARVWSSWFTIV
jgi:hypothetical protein